MVLPTPDALGCLSAGVLTAGVIDESQMETGLSFRPTGE